MLEFYGICICTVVLTFIFLSHIIPLRSPRRTVVVHTTLQSVRAILNPLDVSRLTQLEARAAANQWLTTAFHLMNTFVRGDIGTNTAFRRRAGRLITNDWLQLVSIAKQAVDATLLAHCCNADIAFDEFVQVVTLRFVICSILCPGTPPASLDGDHLREVGRLITTIWIQSKNVSTSLSAPIIDILRNDLHTHLAALFPDVDQPDNLNLDFLIPTWETFWRVVAPTIAHIHRMVDSVSRIAACNTFLDLLEQGDNATIKARFCSSSSGPSSEHYVAEGLRLTPPVGRIKRHQSRLTQSLIAGILPSFIAEQLVETTIDVADIASAQRSPHWATPLDSAATIEVSPPDHFDPSRFVLEPERLKDVLAFGHGPLKCIAADWAPLAAAIVVAVILDRVDDNSYHLVVGENIGGREPESWEGWRVVQLQ
ncbi:hypothetical protein C8F01DRAFT_985635 [Mycena amicta]|nr:hypothetical protein C8F01DRAFT_985635 [Mycena amicta]